jgi:hypothetical protein
VPPRRPEYTARVDLDRRFGAFGMGATVNASGRSYDDAANQHQVGGYATIDSRASWHVAPAWPVEARLANVSRAQCAGYSMGRDVAAAWTDPYVNVTTEGALAMASRSGSSCFA